MISRLDRYVAATVLGAYVATVAFLVGMFTVSDLLLRMDRYVEAAERLGMGTFAMLWEVARYELLSVPFMFVRIAPFVTVIASMFALTRLMSANEIVPMLFTGRSAFRILRPVFLLGILSTLAMAATWQWVLPEVRNDYEQARLFVRGRDSQEILGNITVRAPEDQDRELFCHRYWTEDRRMERVVLYRRGKVSGDGSYVGAATATWDPDRGDWRLTGARRIVVAGVEREVREPEFLGTPSITPTLIEQSEMEKRDTMLLSYTELLELLALRSDRSDYQLALQSHFTFPLANVLLQLLVLPFALRFEQTRRIESVLAAILMCALYLVTDLTCQNLVFRGSLHAVVGAWTPTIVFGSLAAVVFGSARG